MVPRVPSAWEVSLTGNKEGRKGLLVLRGKPTPTRFPTNMYDARGAVVLPSQQGSIVVNQVIGLAKLSGQLGLAIQLLYQLGLSEKCYPYTHTHSPPPLDQFVTTATPPLTSNPLDAQHQKAPTRRTRLPVHTPCVRASVYV